MKNELTVFENNMFGAVRVIEIDGEPWFVGKDVAECLGYADTKHAILDHVENEDRVNSKTQGQNDPDLGQRGSWLVNESGIYSLIMGSKLPSAKEFKRWVTSEVIPSIRKHGAYMTPDTIELALADPDFIIGLATRLKSEQLKTRELEAVIEEQEPKVKFAEA
jgi:prophage antirepressor-like protein